MSWKLRLSDRDDPLQRARPQVGDCWYADYYVDDEVYRNFFDKRKSAEYVSDAEGKRAPIIVCIPDGNGGVLKFCPDMRANGDAQGWRVTGELPNITITPSINAEGIYHGFVTEGVLSDDVEGRTFD